MTDKTQFPVFTAGTLPSAPSMNGMTVLVEASDGTRSRRFSNGVEWTDDLTAAQVDATQALVSGAWSGEQIVGEHYAGVSTLSGGNEAQNSRILYTATEDINTMRLVFDALAVDHTYSAALEYPVGTSDTPLSFTVAGTLSWVTAANGSGTITDPLGCAIPAGAQYAIRTYAQVAGGQILRPVSRYLVSGETTSGLADKTDYTRATGALTGGSTGPSNQLTVAPHAIISVSSRQKRAILGEGDSIQAGSGIPPLIYPSAINYFRGNWFAGGMLDAGHPNFVNHSVGGQQLATMFDGSSGGATAWRTRMAKHRYVQVVISNLSTNDLQSGGKTWQQVATYQLQRARLLWRMGVELILVTNTPVTSATLSGCQIFASEQSPSILAARTSYNDWIRGGFQTDSSGTPVVSGGTRSLYMTRYFDAAAAVEINASNVLTQNGGRWICQAAAYTGKVSTGSPTLTAIPCSAGGFPAYTGTSFGLQTYAVRVTSGAASGQSAVITSANSATNLPLVANNGASISGATISGLTTALTAGDTFDVYQTATNDGLHPTPWGHSLIRAAFAAWVAQQGF